MRQCIRAAVSLLLFFVLCGLGFGQVTLTASTSISTPSALTAGSFVRVTLAPGPNTLALDVSGAYTGQLVVCLSYAGSSGPLRTLPGALISDCINAGSTGIPANGQGAWSTRVSGPGYAYVAATSLTGAGPSVFLSGGAGGGSLSASDATPNTSLATVATNTGLLPVNPNPLSLCFFDKGGSGCTIAMEYCDATGTTIPLVDSNGALWPSTILTLSAGATLGSSYGLLHQYPTDGTTTGSYYISALPSNVAYVNWTVLTGTANVYTLTANTGGTIDGSAGTGGTGYVIGHGANGASPIRCFVLDSKSTGRVRS